MFGVAVQVKYRTRPKCRDLGDSWRRGGMQGLCHEMAMQMTTLIYIYIYIYIYTHIYKRCQALSVLGLVFVCSGACYDIYIYIYVYICIHI